MSNICSSTTLPQVNRLTEMGKERLELARALVRASDKSANPKAKAKAKAQAGKDKEAPATEA